MTLLLMDPTRKVYDTWKTISIPMHLNGNCSVDAGSMRFEICHLCCHALCFSIQGFFSPRNVGNYCQLNILLTILRCDNIIYLNISVRKKKQKNTRILTEWSTTEKDVFWGAECYFICKAYANQLNLNHTI